MCTTLVRCLVALLFVLAEVSTSPLSLIQSDHPPLTAELSSRMAAHASRLQESKDPRLPIPTPQDLEAIRKVAQVLVMLGEQVIPALINGAGPENGGSKTEIPYDIDDKN
ncbi:uncharacterized protein LOC123662156 [Melitaea cinxia]|uniref:uncharacterized protein LOC123662156 n=1 Tax=Melitaea cinxia TaxID=113334 RepID=UPI001E272E1C|nr:uncharacterized protein LOC123662156 [Melitaea cinxia]